MKKLTLKLEVDDEILLRARGRAKEEGSSVEQLLQSYLRAYSDGVFDQRRAFQKILRIADSHDIGGRDRTWSRDELHERR